MKKPWGPDLDTPFFGHAITIHNLGHETFLDLHMIGSVHSCANLQGPHQTPKLLPRRYGTCSCGWEAHGSLQAFLKHLLAWVICWMWAGAFVQPFSQPWKSKSGQWPAYLQPTKDFRESAWIWDFYATFIIVHSETLQGSVSSWGKKKIIFTPRCCAFWLRFLRCLRSRWTAVTRRPSVSNSTWESQIGQSGQQTTATRKTISKLM